MKKLLLLLALSAGIPNVLADTLTPAEALSRFLGTSDNTAKRAAAYGTPKFVSAVNSSDSKPAVYIFSQNNSLLFIGADDVAQPLLGYTDTDASGQMPPQLEWWLSGYAEQISHASARKPSAVAIDTAPSAPMPSPAKANRVPVFRFLPSDWNQGTPYNDLCPTVDGKKCYTGCTATAAAQIMNYHRYPAQGVGSITYTPNQNSSVSGLYKGTLTLDFSTITFDWDNMIANYETTTGTAAQKTAVATLMKAVGYAAEMNYGTNASGAATSVCLQGMKDYFGYNSAGVSLDRASFSRSAWEDLIYENLRDVGPVLYSGFNLTSAGHSFVCDAYYDGYFHFNWGWGGSYNGFFSLTALTPQGEGIGGNGSGDYSFDQSACLNITKPGQRTITIEGADFVSRGNLTATINNGNIDLTTDQNWVALNNTNNTIKETFALRLVAEDGSTQLLRWQYSYSELPPGYGFNSLQFPISGNLADGKYKVYLVCKPYGQPDSDFQRVGSSVGTVDFTHLIVSGGNPSIENVAAPSLEITNFTVETALYLFTDFKVSYSVANNSEIEILDGIQPYIYTKTTSSPASPLRAATAGTAMAAVGDGMLYDLMPGESQATTQTSGMTCYTSSVPSGQVYIGLRSSNTGKILAEKAVSLGNKPAAASLSLNSFSFDGNAGAADANDLRFNVGVKCNSGYMSSPVRVLIFPNQTTGTVYSIADLKSKSLFLNKGESDNVTVSGMFAAGETGKSYFALPYNNSTQLGNNRLYFTIGSAVSGIEQTSEDSRTDNVGMAFDRDNSSVIVTASSAIATVEAYAADGRRVAVEIQTGTDNAVVRIPENISGIIILHVTLADGTCHSGKFAL